MILTRKRFKELSLLEQNTTCDTLRPAGDVILTRKRFKELSLLEQNSTCDTLRPAGDVI